MEQKDHISFWDLIAGKLHGELDHNESALFEKELENKQNQNLFEKGNRIHLAIRDLKDLQESDKDDSWNTIYKQVRTKKINILTKNLLKYAAILAIAFSSGFYAQSRLTPKDKEQEVQYAEVEVMYGQTGHLFLFDGTEVWLNSGSKFKYPNKFNQKERNVYIEGEAFFKVTPNKNLPFKVKTEKLEVEVLGTSFNVSAYPQDQDQSVVLVEGKVQINNPEGTKIGEITPGQIALKTEGDETLKIQDIDPYFYTSWKDGKVTFHAESLYEIAKKMERWYNVEIRFEKENLKNYKFSGTILRNKPIDQTIMAMELLAPIKFNYQVRVNEKNVITIINK